MSFRLSALVLTVALGACGGGSSPPAGESAAEAATLLAQRMPEGAPPAALDALASLPEPAATAWPFGQHAPKTSGTGRYAAGAYWWTDFLYDANGAAGVNPPLDHILTPTGGAMVFPDEPALQGNGADLFRIGIGMDEHATYWRVDWQTLADAAVPFAAFALDYRDGGTTALQDWPGLPRLRSAGVDAVLLLSGKGYRLLDADGSTLHEGSVEVDLAAQSFVARLPRAVLDPAGGSWRIRLAAALHDGRGGVRDEMLAFGGLPTQPPVFNLAFRDYRQETPTANFWFDNAQAARLAVNDATAFVLALDWSRLDRRRIEPEPLVAGYSNRWYVSSLDTQAEYGRGGALGGFAGSTAHPVFMDRVQPYGFFLPSGYDPASPAPLTLLLHAFMLNHNHYSGMTPNFLRDICEARQSICLSPLGRGPNGQYEGDAELDLWDAWQDIAADFALDPERVTTAGFSMGANASLRLLTIYPDVFANALILAGQAAAEPRLTLLENLQWNGYYHGHGLLDELEPFGEARATIDRLQALGHAYTFDQFLLEDHLLWPLKDLLYPAFADASDWLLREAPATRKRQPGEIRYSWLPTEQQARLGLGAQGPWWLGDLQAADDSSLARVQAHSEGLPEPALLGTTLARSPALSLLSPSPRIRERQTLRLGAEPVAGGRIRLELRNVAALSLDLAAAGIAQRPDRRLQVSTDQPLRLRLQGLPAGTRAIAATTQATATAAGLELQLPAGEDQAVALR